MEKTIKIRSSFLSVLNEALQKVTLNDTVKNFTPVIVEADGKFTSIVKTENDFDPSVLGANIDVEEDETENDIQKKETKEQLLNKAKEAIEQTVNSSSELKDILKRIKDLSKSDNNKWQLNREHNTASLPSRNTHIFKQNNNLCVSHNGKIELFHSVAELRKWLSDNHYPLPDDSIVIHESVELEEKGFDGKPSPEFYGKHGNNNRNWVDLLNKYNNDKKTNNTLKLKDQDRSQNDDYRGLSKRINKEIYQADMHKKEEPKISDKFLNFDNDDEMTECLGGGITSVSSLGSPIQHLANKIKNKREEKKEDLDEAINEDFPDFAPQAKDDPNLPTRGQGGKKAEAFINSLIKNPETIQKLKNGEFKALPFTKKDYLNVLQSIYYQYSGTHVGNSNWPKKVKQVLKSEASDLLSKFEKQELDQVENDIVSTFVQIYSESGAEMTNEGLIDGLALALDDIFRRNEPQFSGFNQQLANKLTSYLNQDFGDVKVEIKPGDTLLYGKTAVEQDDINNPENKQILYKLNKHISKGEDDQDDTGNLNTRKAWNIENFKIYMQKKNISNILKGLYDAIYSPDSKAKFADTNDAGVSKWMGKNKDNMISLLTDEEINEIKASWNDKKIEIKQEQPTIEPTPTKINAEIKQEDELSDNEKKILDTLLIMNPNLDISKLTTAQLREKINKAMALFGESKQESIFESAVKHPWLNKIMGKRLVEDDSPADFASGSPISSDMDATSDTTASTVDTSTVTPDIDIGGDTTTQASPNNFGDVDISVGGYDPEGEGEDNNVPAPTTPEYQIIDVLANTEDPTDIKVKLKNTETGEIEIKNLSEI